MKAAIITEQGATPVYGDFERPEALSGELRVQVSASALSRLTRGRAAGSHYSASNLFPFVPGVDGVGRLEDGSRVYFAMPRAPYGAMSEETVVDKALCVAVTDDLDDVAAAALANPGMSSWAALRHRARFQPGETVLVNGATGVSGRLAVGIAKHMGASKIIVTGRNPHALEELKGLGADAALSLADDDLDGRLRQHFAEGVDVVLDYLWGETARAILATGARYGAHGRRIRFIQIGAMAGGEISLPAAVLRSSAIEMMGSGIGSVSTENLVASIGEMFAAATEAGLVAETTAVPLFEIESAWNRADIASRIVFTMR